MNRDMKNKNIIQSIKCASKGIAACYREERNFREYTVIAAVFLAFNILLGAAVWEYIVFFSLVLGTFAIVFKFISVFPMRCIIIQRFEFIFR